MISQPDDECWAAWRPEELGAIFYGIGKPWCIVGGWALDLWHGAQTREHDDLEFTVLRDDFQAFRAVFEQHGMAFYTAHGGVVTFLPSGQAPAPGISQIWCHDTAAACWRVDMMIEPGTPETWIYKRDTSITRPRGEMVTVTDAGLPFLRPSGVLLFKAKHLRDKDEADFMAALPNLDPAERAWLRSALQKCHPDHGWLKLLTDQGY